jgi:hypothetical protein
MADILYLNSRTITETDSSDYYRFPCYGLVNKHSQMILPDRDICLKNIQTLG